MVDAGELTIAPSYLLEGSYELGVPPLLLLLSLTHGEFSAHVKHKVEEVVSEYQRGYS
jgi:hypothetical protein